MEGKHQFNIDAQIFTPGQPWSKIDEPAQRLSKPLIVYGDLDQYGRSISYRPPSEPLPPQHPSNLKNDNIAEIDFRFSKVQISIRDTLQERVKVVDADLALRRLQELIDGRRRLTHPHVDNTVPAMQARFLFDRHFGSDTGNLQAWQDLCYFCGRDAENMAMTIRDCKKWLRRIYVNVFDLMDAVRAYDVVEPWFDTAHDLEIYSRQTGKICPVAAGDGNDIFRFMLRRWY